MALTDIKVKNAKPKEKPYKLADAEGLFLLVTPKGAKYWRLKYRFNGREIDANRLQLNCVSTFFARFLSVDRKFVE